MPKPTRSTVSITLTLSPLAHGVLSALARLSAGGAEPRAGALVEDALHELADRRAPGVWSAGELRAFTLRAEGLTTDKIAAGVAELVLSLALGRPPARSDASRVPPDPTADAEGEALPASERRAAAPCAAVAAVGGAG